MDDELDVLDASARGDDLDKTARTLSRARPVPAPAFRGALERLVRALQIPPVRHLRAKALCLALAGALLLALAGAGVAGSGPLAPG